MEEILETKLRDSIFSLVEKAYPNSALITFIHGISRVTVHSKQLRVYTAGINVYDTLKHDTMPVALYTEKAESLDSEVVALCRLLNRIQKFVQEV